MHTIRPFLFIAALDTATKSRFPAQLVSSFQSFGFHCFTYTSVADLLEGVALHSPERALVLLGGEQQSVRHALAFLRALHPGYPLLVQCETKDTAETVAAYEGGADIVFAHNAPVAVWVAACSAALRRLSQLQPPTAVVPPNDTWVFNAAMSQLATPQGVKVDLSVQERRLLEQLISAPSHSVSRQQLISTVLNDEQADDGRASGHLGVIISRLRKKIQRTGVSLPLSTVHSHGYRFTAPVRQAPDP